jgi:hypothetical protein
MGIEVRPQEGLPNYQSLGEKNDVFRLKKKKVIWDTGGSPGFRDQRIDIKQLSPFSSSRALTPPPPPPPLISVRTNFSKD